MAVKLLNILGTTLMVLIIAVALPLTIPKMFGCQLYEVLTGSMEPVYPTGSLIYVRAAAPGDIKTGDAITYYLSAGTDMAVTHRVAAIDEEDQSFTTKGDANNAPDPAKVSFKRLIGKPVFCIPYYGYLSQSLHTVQGMTVSGFVFAVSIFSWTAAEVLKRKRIKNI